MLIGYFPVFSRHISRIIAINIRLRYHGLRLYFNLSCIEDYKVELDKVR